MLVACPVTPVGHLSSLVNAAVQEHDNQNLRAVSAVVTMLRHARHHHTVTNSHPIPSAVPSVLRVPALSACASISQSTQHLISRLQRQRHGQAHGSGNGILHGILDCPNQRFFASLSANSLAGAMVKTVRAGVVSVNGQLALQGVTLQDYDSIALDEASVREVFDEIDANRDGCIDAKEFLLLLDKMGLPTNSHYMSDLMNQYTTHGAQDNVTFDRFLNYVHKQHSKMAKAFRDLDVNDTGFLTEDGLLVALQSMGLSAERSDAHKMIELLDSTNSLRVTFSQFCRYACLLPAAQLNNDNVAFCWVDSTDFVDGIEYRLGMTPSKQTYQRLIAGGVAGAISRSMVAPLERLRTIMMASVPALSMKECVACMWKDGAFKGLFKGNMATVIKVLPASALQFAAYDGIKDLLRVFVPREEGASLAAWERLTAGCIAGAASSCITYPLETIRTMMSMPGCSTGTFMQVSTEALRRRGLFGLYRGYSSSIINEMLGTGLGFLAYEYGQQVWESVLGVKPGPRDKGIVGALSATLVMTATMPFELIMRRMQIANTPKGAQFQYAGTVDAFRQICRTEGFAAFYRGSLFAYAKVVPSIGAMYMLYELIKKAMAIGGLRSYDQDQKVMAERKAARRARQQKQLEVQAQAAANPVPMELPTPLRAQTKVLDAGSHLV